MSKKDKVISKIKKEDLQIFEIDGKTREIVQRLNDEGVVTTDMRGFLQVVEEECEENNKKDNNRNETVIGEYERVEKREDAKEVLETMENFKQEHPMISEIYSDARIVFSFAEENQMDVQQGFRLYRLVSDLGFFARILKERSE